MAGDLDDLARAGMDANTLLHTTTSLALPDDHAASALSWRLQRHLHADRDVAVGGASHR
jgi:hypothetical protein